MMFSRVGRLAAVSRRCLLTSNRLMVPRIASFVSIPQRGYYKDDILMPREQGEYYADPMDVAERTVRVIGLHDNVNDPSAVTVSKTFEELGLNALDMAEIFLGVEREFDLEISEEDCEAMRTVNDLVEFLARNPSTK